MRENDSCAGMQQKLFFVLCSLDKSLASFTTPIFSIRFDSFSPCSKTKQQKCSNASETFTAFEQRHAPHRTSRSTGAAREHTGGEEGTIPLKLIAPRHSILEDHAASFAAMLSHDAAAEDANGEEEDAADNAAEGELGGQHMPRSASIRRSMHIGQFSR
jgi:hypothetical protein